MIVLAARDPATRRINVVVETPMGSRNKYKYDEGLGLFRLHKQLPAGATFPFDFGFIPATRGEDGDPLDMLVLVEEPTCIGCLVTARLLGALRAKQTEGRRTLRNDRLIGVAETDKIKPRMRRLRDLSAELLDQIEHFFVSYNRFEGRDFRITGRLGSTAAALLIEAGIRRYRAEQRMQKTTHGK